MSTKFLFILIAALFLSKGSCRRNAEIVNADIRYNVAYGPNERNKMDVFLPLNRDSSTPTVILIHGGAWIIGSKTDWPASVINGILKQGFAVSCINYRYACRDFHKQIEDIQMAIDYINANADNRKTGKNKFGLVGVSAGGHLALLFAHAYDSSHIVKAVVSMVGPTDLTDTLFHQYVNNYGIGFVFQRFLGATMSSNPQVYADASPIFHYGRVPSLFINGKLDNLVPPTQAIRMFDTLKAHGIIADTTVFGNAGHNVYGPKNVNLPQINDEIDHWMQTYLR